MLENRKGVISAARADANEATYPAQSAIVCETGAAVSNLSESSHTKLSKLPPRVDVIVLNWNGCNDTLACLISLARIDYENFRVVVVDNGSTDHSIESIRRIFPAVKIIENGANLGFASGNNRGIAEALLSDVDYVLLLNNDTEVDPGILHALVAAAEKMLEAGIFGPKIYYHSHKDKLWYAGGYWDAHTLTFGERGAGVLDEGQFDTLEETLWVIGCAMFVRASVFRSIGLLEPKFFLNNEEIDFCSRARRAGFACAFVPDARVWHKISVSFGGEHSPLKEYFSARNRLLWASRNANILLRMRIHASVMLTLVRRLLLPSISGASPSARSPKGRWWTLRSSLSDPRNRAYVIGVRDYYLRRFGDCPDTIRELSKAWTLKRASGAAPQHR